MPYFAEWFDTICLHLTQVQSSLLDVLSQVLDCNAIKCFLPKCGHDTLYAYDENEKQHQNMCTLKAQYPEEQQPRPRP